MAVLRTLTLNGTTYTIESSLPVAQTVTLAPDQWVGSDGIYSQVVAVEGITTLTKIDIQPTDALLASLYEKSYGLYVMNEDGVVRVYAVGKVPAESITIQLTKTEVEL